MMIMSSRVGLSMADDIDEILADMLDDFNTFYAAVIIPMLEDMYQIYRDNISTWSDTQIDDSNLVGY